MPLQETSAARKNTRPKRGASWLAAIMAAAPLALFGELLIQRTHHRPLGAVTFATFALLAWLVAEFVSRRILCPEAQWGAGGADTTANGPGLTPADAAAPGHSSASSGTQPTPWAKWRRTTRRLVQVAAVLGMLLVVIRAVL